MPEENEEVKEAYINIKISESEIQYDSDLPTISEVIFWLEVLKSQVLEALFEE